jgi:lysophospholipase L1-like esterase
MDINTLSALITTKLTQQDLEDRITGSEHREVENAIVAELLARGVTSVADTTALSLQSGANFKYVIVTDNGIYKYASSGVANGTTIFAATGGGVYERILAQGGGGGTAAWDDITGKPSTFPPTLPIAGSAITEDSDNRFVSDTEKTTWSAKQDALVSGTNIKTVAGNALPGSGNITTDQLLPSQAGANGKVLQSNGTTAAWETPSGGGGGGSVSSVGVSAPADLLTVGGSPVTGAGTIALTKPVVNANKVYAGPASGADAVPTFRVLTEDDVPGIKSGVAPTEVGLIVDDTFPGSAINSGIWSTALPVDASITGGALVVTSGLADYTRYIQLIKQAMYEKEEFTIDFQANSKNAGDGFGIWMSSPLLLYNNVLYIKVNLSNDSNSGCVSFGATTAATEYGVSQPLAFNVGDNLRLRIRRTPWKTITIFENITTPATPKAYGEFNTSNWGTQGKLRLAFLGGAQSFTDFKINCRETNYGGTSGVVFAGDSLTNGSGASTVDRRWTNITMKSQQHKFTNLGIGSWLIGTWNTHLSNDVLPALDGKYLVLAFGYNDVGQLTALATFEASLDTAVTYAQGLGYTVVLLSIVPSVNADVTPYNTRIQNVATARSCKYIDITTPLFGTGTAPNLEYLYDGVHLNDSGYKVLGDTVFRYAPELTENILADIDETPVIAHNLPVGLNTYDLLTIDPFSVVHRVSREQWLNNAYVRLQPTSYETQSGNISISGNITTANGSSWVQKSSSGLRISYNNGTDTIAAVSNMQIHDFGQGGAGQIQAWASFTGTASGNVIIGASNNYMTKGGAAPPSISGSKNLLFNTKLDLSGSENVFFNAFLTGISSGANNVGIGRYALVGVTTGNANVHINTNIHDQTVTYPAGLNYTFIVGNPIADSYVSEDVAFCGYFYSATKRIWLGGRGTAGTNIELHAAGVTGTNAAGATFTIHGSRGTGTGAGGPIIFSIAQSGASGATLHTTYTEKFRVSNAGIRTEQPSGSGAGDWKLGTLITAAVTPDTSRYLEVSVGGTVYKVIVSS